MRSKLTFVIDSLFIICLYEFLKPSVTLFRKYVIIDIALMPISSLQINMVQQAAYCSA